jgi:lipoprotein-anchoring transpeptidase ErfK/SrfK
MRKIAVLLALFVVTACSTPGNALEAVAVPTVTSTRLVIPTITMTQVASTPTPVMVTPTSTPIPTYVVQEGETLKTIAEKFGTNETYLADVNGLNNPKHIKVGQVIALSGTPYLPIPITNTGKEIDVVIGLQRAYAFENGILIREFIVSTGRDPHPTVVGIFRIEAKYPKVYMSDGATYFLPDVPSTQFFGNDTISWHEGYSFHGAYWHDNFGTPMSHGCVNMRLEDAAWLYDWTTPIDSGRGETIDEKGGGTLVTIW